MELAILFWFYKEPDICENRLRLLRKYNPDITVYGLFGGVQEEADTYRKRLGKYLDDFYVSLETDPNRKWIHGDLMILEWFGSRGRNLKWDSIAIVQWDMLVFTSLREYFSDMRGGEIFLSGLRMLDDEIESRWNWTKSDGIERGNYLSFRDHISRRYGYAGDLLACLFIFEIFPRIFFERYLEVSDREVGMLEYKVPTYAKIFNIPFYKRNLGVWWFAPEAESGHIPLNARGVEIPEAYIREELEKPGGYRIFHPYFELWPIESK